MPTPQPSAAPRSRAPSFLHFCLPSPQLCSVSLIAATQATAAASTAKEAGKLYSLAAPPTTSSLGRWHSQPSVSQRQKELGGGSYRTHRRESSIIPPLLVCLPIAAGTWGKRRPYRTKHTGLSITEPTSSPPWGKEVTQTAWSPVCHFLDSHP